MGKPFEANGFVSLTSPTGEGGWRLHSPENLKQGIPEAFTPSLNNFDKPKSFMDDIKESAVSEMIEDSKRQLGSPSWVWKAQENLNHTGEQPLIVQQYLSSNKREQEDGVLPAKQPHKSRFLSHSAGSYKSPRLYQLSITAHQFLTATDMPNESEKIVDHRHGRPTRTSLLRARRRIPSAPGVKATFEFKTNLHLQQSLAAKREDKYKTVEVPEELLPVTDNGETVHQFLVGARYNRGHYRDAKCLTDLGLYVCRDDTTKCFLRTSSSHQHVSPRTQPSDFLSNGKLTQSLSSIRNIQSGSKASSLRPKSALVGSKSKQAWASAPCSSPTDSRNSFESSSGNQSKPGTKVKVIDGNCLESKDQTSSSSSVQEDGCVMCETGVTLCKGSIPAWSRSERRNSNPARLWSGRKKGNVKRATEDGATDRMKGEIVQKGEGSVETPTAANVPKQVQQMVLQQYHLRIMGRKVEVEDGIPSAPRSNFLYQNVRTVKTSPQASGPTSRGRSHKSNNNNNTRKNRRAKKDDLSEPERPASQISVHITSTKSLSEDGDSDGSRRWGDVTDTGHDRSEGREMAEACETADGDREVKSTDKPEREDMEEKTTMEGGGEIGIGEQAADGETRDEETVSGEEPRGKESCLVNNETESEVCLERGSEETSGRLNKLMINDGSNNGNHDKQEY